MAIDFIHVGMNERARVCVCLCLISTIFIKYTCIKLKSIIVQKKCVNIVSVLRLIRTVTNNNLEHFSNKHFFKFRDIECCHHSYMDIWIICAVSVLLIICTGSTVHIKMIGCAEHF